jgi:two-component system LytT family response regulator
MKSELVHLGSRKTINPSKILLLKADTNYTLIYLVDGTEFMTATNLGTLEERLKDFNFYRTHRSTLINLKYVSDIEIDFLSGNFEVMRMNSNLNIRVARRKIPDFLRTLQIKATDYN